MADVRIQCCDICGKPLEHTDNRTRNKIVHAPKEGLKLELGFSRGGWGRREDWLNFSGEVCGECFKTASDLLEPLVGFVRNHGERQGDQASLRPSELPPKGRGKQIRGVLRALSHTPE